MNKRRGATAVEAMIAVGILGAAFVPLYTLIQSNQSIAFLNEFHVVARRRARQALAPLSARTYGDLKDMATGAGPPAVPGLGGQSIPLVLATAEDEKALLALPGKMIDGYGTRLKTMQTQVFFEELRPGFAKLSALVEWVDQTQDGKQTKRYTTFRFVQDPFHYRGAP